jgi:hypothetical protein
MPGVNAKHGNTLDRACVKTVGLPVAPLSLPYRPLRPQGPRSFTLDSHRFANIRRHQKGWRLARNFELDDAVAAGRKRTVRLVFEHLDRCCERG